MRFRQFLIIMVFIISLPICSSAQIDDLWRFSLRAGQFVDGKATKTHIPFDLGTSPDASDGFDHRDRPNYPFRYSGYGWTESADMNSSYCSDIRSPMLTNEIQVWHIRAYLVGQSSGAFDLMGYTNPQGWIERSSVVVGVYEGYLTALDYQSAIPLVAFDGGLVGTSTNPQFISRLFYTNNYKDITVVANAVPEKYALQEIYPVPEMSSLLALSGGITAFGFGRLRKRR